MGVTTPADAHRVAALLRRIAAFTLVIALALLALTAMAQGTGRDLIADYEVNGEVTGCYTDAEFREALRILRADEVLYGNAIDVIQEARPTHTRAEGEEGCEGEVAAEGTDESGTGLGLWLGLAAAVALIAVGAGLWARRGGSGGDGPAGDGTEAASSGPGRTP